MSEDSKFGTLTMEQIKRALEDLEYVKVCDEKEHWAEMVDIAIVALKTYQEYAQVIQILNKHMQALERQIIEGNPTGLQQMELEGSK